MIISHKHKFIFLKVQKTAGTSTEIALSEHCEAGDILTPLHPDDEAIRKQAGFRGMQNYMTPLHDYSLSDVINCIRYKKRKRYFNHSNAAAVRGHIGADIWDSYFKFCFERNPYDKAISHYYWVTQEPRPSIAEYLAETEENYLSDWDMYTLNDQVAVDFIGRYENLHDDLAAVSEQLKIRLVPLVHTKSDIRKDKRAYRTVLDSTARAHIERIFANELRAFNYSW
jgi:hypothetical protein